MSYVPKHLAYPEPDPIRLALPRPGAMAVTAGLFGALMLAPVPALALEQLEPVTREQQATTVEAPATEAGRPGVQGDDEPVAPPAGNLDEGDAADAGRAPVADDSDDAPAQGEQDGQDAGEKPVQDAGDADKGSAQDEQDADEQGANEDGAPSNDLADNGLATDPSAPAQATDAPAQKADAAPESVSTPSEAGWAKGEDGSWHYWDEVDGEFVAHTGWLVTGVRPGAEKDTGLQRYWLDELGKLVYNQLIDAGNGWWAYATENGYVVRGKYTAKNGYVYLADNDGRLEGPGWVVTGKYDGGGLQRYWIDAESHAAEPGFSKDGWSHYTTSKGYVLRGGSTIGGKRYYADNDGKLAEGWVVTGDFTKGALERYWMKGGAAVTNQLVNAGNGWWAYARSDGRVVRGKYVLGNNVYIADNDGRLEGPGWVVTGKYDGGGLQRYWIDPTKHCAVKGFSKDGWAHYTTAKGYVLRGKTTISGRVYLANNDGRLATATGWVVTGAYDGGAMQRYWLAKDSNGYSYAKTGVFEVSGEHYYGLPTSGYVFRGKARYGSGILIADNGGKLAWTKGWLVTSKYDGGMQRYYIDSIGDGFMGAKLGWFTVGGSRYFGRADKGYVMRNTCLKDGSKWYYCNNDGVATYLPTGKIGWQNPAGLFQVSAYSVSPVGSGMFSYVTPSRISPDATREECIEAFIARAYEYLGTPYKWDWACKPGEGVDCSGLVLQCLYAVGMDLSPMNPYDHYYTPGHDQYANQMRQSSGFRHVSFSERKRGDLIFWEGHVAIYLGNNQIIEATAPEVRIASVFVYGTNSILAVARPFV